MRRLGCAARAVHHGCGNRPTGTNALLEDVVVPVDVLGATCRDLTALFDAHGYQDSVIFGHAKDGNIHFMLNEQFRDAKQLVRYREFTEEMVQLIWRLTAHSRQSTEPGVLWLRLCAVNSAMNSLRLCARLSA